MYHDGTSGPQEYNGDQVGIWVNSILIFASITSSTVGLSMPSTTSSRSGNS
jgi:hypothetical protein